MWHSSPRAEIFLHVLRPLIGFRQQHLALGIGVELGAQLPDDGVGFRQVLVVGAVALAQIGDRIEPEAVDAGIEPALHHLHQRADHARIVEIEIRLVREEAVPVEGAGFRVPGPVRLLGVGEDDPRARIFLVGIAPDIPVARARFGIAAAGALEPVVLVGGMIDDEFGDDPQAAPLGLDDEAAEILHGPEIGIDGAVVGDVVAVVAAGRGIERQQPQRGDAEVLQIAELLGQAREIADAVIVAVGKGLDVKLIDDGVLVPELVAVQRGDRQLRRIDGRQQVHGAPHARQRKSRRARIVESAAGRGALDSLNCFVHGDAIDMEMTSRFVCGKGDAPDPYRKPLAGHWFPGNAGDA